MYVRHEKRPCKTTDYFQHYATKLPEISCRALQHTRHDYIIYRQDAWAMDVATSESILPRALECTISDYINGVNGYETRTERWASMAHEPVNAEPFVRALLRLQVQHLALPSVL